MRFSLNLRTSQQGIALLLALLIMAGVTASAIVASVLIVRELRQSQSLDASIAAYHAAESGIEKSLWIIKEARRSGADLADVITDLEASGEPVIRGSWDIDATSITDSFEVTLQADQSAQVDLYDPDGNAGAGVESVEVVSWEPVCDDPILIPQSQIEWSVVGWFPGDPSALTNVAKAISTCTLNAGVCDRDVPIFPPIPPDPAFDFDAALAYRVRVKALICGAANLEVRAYDQPGGATGGGNLVTIPSRIQVTSIGTYQNTRQGLSVSVPWVLPLSGLYDYVLFSEEDIVK